MEPWGWSCWWEFMEAQEIIKTVAAARHHLLSEFYEAAGVLPFWGDLEAAGVLEGVAAPPYPCFPSIGLFGLPAIMCWDPRIIEAEQICLAIGELRYEIWVYTMRGKKPWEFKTWAEEYGLARKLIDVLDRANKFLSAGKTTLHGHAQTTKGRNTPAVSHKPEDFLKFLNALSDEMVQSYAKTLPKRSSYNTTDGSYPLYVENCGVGVLAVRGINEGISVLKHIRRPYESVRISEKPKPQSANTGSACKDVHGLTGAEPENHCVFLASTDPINKMEFPGFCWEDIVHTTLADRGTIIRADSVVHLDYVPLNPICIWTSGMLGDIFYRDLERGASLFVQFSVETSPKGGIDIKFGSYKIHVPKYGSVHRPIVQMVLFADSLYGATLACLKSIVPKSIVNLYESGRISEKPILQSTNPNVDDLSHVEPEKHGAPDSADCRICCNIGAEEEIAATWLIDTGAVHHATGKLSLLYGVTTVNDDDLFITARDGVRMHVHAEGSVITDRVVLPEVWYIPGLTKNIVSVSQLNQLGYSIGFTRGTCFIRSATDGTLIGKGHVSEDGLFEADFLKVG